MRRYDAYKDSGVKWMGEIPSHWEVKKLRHLIRFVSIKGHGDKCLLSVTREQGVIVRNTESKEENHNFIPENLSGYKLVGKGQFVINKMKSWQGSYGVSNYDGIVSPAYYVCDLNYSCKEFFSMAIRSKAYIPFFTQFSKGIRVDQWDLSPIGLKTIPFMVPPLHEQQAIVDYLKDKTIKIEQYVSAREKERELLDSLKQSEIANVVTRGLNPNVKMKDSGIPWIGEIPEHWEPCRNKDIFEESKKIVGENSSDYVLLSLTKQGVIVRDLSENKGKFPKEFNTYKVVEPGDMIFCMFDVDETPRTVGLSQNHGMITGAYDVFKIKRVLPKFALYYYLSIDDRKALRPLYKGLRKVVPLPTFMSSKIFLPPLSEQQAIVAYIDEKLRKIDQYMCDLQREIDYLKEFKQRLISDAVTGQLCVTKQ